MKMPKGPEWSRQSPDHLRTVRFVPYRKGMGPTFVLDTWDANTYDRHGKAGIAYRLVMVEGGKRTCLFYGDRCNGALLGHPMGGAALDSREGSRSIARSLMTFLTLRPGDTDAEYFARYTREQLAYAEAHGEALSYEVEARFGEG
jgi:hypothetical protein